MGSQYPGGTADQAECDKMTPFNGGPGVGVTRNMFSRATPAVGGGSSRLDDLCAPSVAETGALAGQGTDLHFQRPACTFLAVANAGSAKGR
jgi:hypothetical protein